MKKTISWPRNGTSVLSLPTVLILAITIRLLLPLVALITTRGNALFIDRDTESYVQPALNLISEGQFARWGEAEILRTPGYPLLLVPGLALNNVEFVTIALQIALSVLTVFLVYKITFLLFGKPEIAVIAAFLFAVEPISILYSSKLMSETLFTTLIALFVYFLLRYWKEGSLAYLTLSALVLVASVYVRPIAYYVPILVVVVLFAWILARKHNNSHKLSHIFIFLFLSVLLIGIWQVRNRVEAGYRGFSAAVEHSLYFWDAAAVLAMNEGVAPDEMREQLGFSNMEIYFSDYPDQRELGRGEIFTGMGQEALKIILQNPGTYSVLVIKGIVRTLLDPGATEYLRMFRLYPEAGGLLSLIGDQGIGVAVRHLLEEMPQVFWANLFLAPMVVAYIFLGAYGAAKSRLAISAPIVLLLIMAAYFLVVSAAGIGMHRARHPIMPIVCIFAGYGAYRMAYDVRILRASRRRRPVPAA